MKKIILLFIFSSSFLSHAQSLEFNGNYTYNSFYHSRNIYTGSDIASGSAGPGFNLNVGIKDVKTKLLNFRFNLNYDYYKGDFYSSSGSLAGRSITTAKGYKSTFTLGIFPVNFKILKKIDVSTGIEVGRLVSENYTGHSHGSYLGQKPTYSNLKDERVSSLIYLGGKIRIGYNIKLNDQLTISPHYAFYKGWGGEIRYGGRLLSIRSYFGIGLEKKLKQ